MLFLSGGTGTPKLLQGIQSHLPQEDITVIVNTAEDTWVSGNLVCPDIDTILYLFSGKLDTDKWWGVKNDTFNTHNTLKKLGVSEEMMLGDTDRATHILRSNLLRAGNTLTQATKTLAEQMQVKASVLPMSDETVTTYLQTDQGLLHFQEFWIQERGEPRVEKVILEGVEKATPSREVREAIARENTIIIGPSNPVTSIGPILKLRGMKKMLKNKRVVAMSPIINSEPVSGPAGKLLSAEGYPPTSTGVAAYYADILDLFIIDQQDTTPLKNFPLPVTRMDTMMSTAERSIRIAEKLIEVLKH